LIDFDLYMYVCDLLASPLYRGQYLGKQLMLCIQKDFPEHSIYVMFDEDGYYDKVGFNCIKSTYEIS
jgi:N-acetylglutamate synthase-like GNAT family acetyltransferase